VLWRYGSSKVPNDHARVTGLVYKGSFENISYSIITFDPPCLQCLLTYYTWG